MSALTIKMPDPIMLPATIIVASSRPSDGLNSEVVVVFISAPARFGTGREDNK
jgi:hypothetical protein